MAGEGGAEVEAEAEAGMTAAGFKQTENSVAAKTVGEKQTPTQTLIQPLTQEGTQKGMCSCRSVCSCRSSSGMTLSTSATSRDTSRFSSKPL
jgi:hypothetical protein